MTEKKTYYYPLIMQDKNGFQVSALNDKDRIRFIEYGFVPIDDKDDKNKNTPSE